MCFFFWDLSLLGIMYVYVFVCVCPWKPEEGVRVPVAGVESGRKLYDVVLGTKLVLCKSCMFELPSHLSCPSIFST